MTLIQFLVNVCNVSISVEMVQVHQRLHLCKNDPWQIRSNNRTGNLSSPRILCSSLFFDFVCVALWQNTLCIYINIGRALKKRRNMMHCVHESYDKRIRNTKLFRSTLLSFHAWYVHTLLHNLFQVKPYNTTHLSRLKFCICYIRWINYKLFVSFLSAVKFSNSFL